MGSRGTLLAAVLVLALLLTGAWLAELPPFAPADDAKEESAKRDAPVADPGDTPAPTPPPKEPATPGLKATAPKDLLEPPADVRPPVEPEVQKQPLQPATPPPEQFTPGADPGPVELDVDVTGITVTKAIDKATAWLRKKQARNGSWGAVATPGAYKPLHSPEPTTQAAGPTALAVYTLLRAGQPLKDPVIRKGLDFLRKHHQKPATSMEAAMLLLAVTATAEDPDFFRRRRKKSPRLRGIYRGWARDLVDHLVEKREARGWRYNVVNRVEPLQAGGPEDLVSTHLAALALFSAHRLGVKVEARVWGDILRYVLDQQEGNELHRPDPAKPRGFAYILGHPVADGGKATGGATACGVATLHMAMHVLTDGKGYWRPPEAREWNPLDTANAGIGAAHAWLVTNWSPYANPGKAKGAKVLHHHWLWALETAMDLDPKEPRLLGTHIWYLACARELVNRQRRDGSWHVRGTFEPASVLDTCFASLFLKRASRGLIEKR